MPTDPTGRIVNNAVQSNRYANGIVRDVSALFNGAGAELSDMLYKRNPYEGYRTVRLRAISKNAAGIFHQLYGETSKLVADQVVDFAVIQELFAAKTLETMIGAAAVDLTTKKMGRAFWRAVIAEDPIQGAVMKEWWSTQNRNTAFAFRSQVQHGMAQQETIQQIVRRVRGRSIGHGRFAGGVMQASTRHATALVRTAVNQISNRAHMELYAANSDITKRYQYVATLDNRTTMICASLDGNVYRYGEGPLPPQHFACRSTTVPVIDWEAEGFDKPPEGMRASKDGPVPASTDYEGWLKTQKGSVQDTVLGKKRAQLFRDNKVNLRDLVRQDTSVLTLDELQRRVAG